MNAHVKAVHEKVKDKICPVCSKEFFDSGAMGRHIKSIHEDKRDFPRIRIKDKKCSKWDFASDLVSKLMIHIKAVSLKVRDNYCTECDHASSDKAVLLKHIRTVHEKFWNKKCPHCDHLSSTNRHLTQHIRAIHDKIKDQKCPYCDHATTQRGALTIHIKAAVRYIKTVHGKIKDMKCTQCDHVFSDKGNLTKHVKAVHKKVRDKKCPHCHSVSSSTGNLAKHTKAVHDLIRDNKCSDCSHATSAKSNLNQHNKDFHDKTTSCALLSSALVPDQNAIDLASLKAANLRLGPSWKSRVIPEHEENSTFRVERPQGAIQEQVTVTLKEINLKAPLKRTADEHSIFSQKRSDSNIPKRFTDPFWIEIRERQRDTSRILGELMQTALREQAVITPASFEPEETEDIRDLSESENGAKHPMDNWDVVEEEKSKMFSGIGLHFGISVVEDNVDDSSRIHTDLIQKAMMEPTVEDYTSIDEYLKNSLASDLQNIM
jgi:hypothetical protein